MPSTYSTSEAQPVVVLEDQELRTLLDIPSTQSCIDRVLRALSIGDAAVMPRMRVDCGGVKLSTMGALWPKAGFAAEKVYTTVSGRFNFALTLFDLASGGTPVAWMHGSELTRVRTPALTVLATAAGAASTRKLAVFGAGQQGRAHIEAALGQFPFAEVAVVDPADATTWCAEASARFGLPVRQSSADSALDGADVVFTTTRSKQPVFDGRRLLPGTFVAAVGTSLPDGRELDDATLERARQVVVEWKPQSLLEAGEVVIGKQRGVLSNASVVDLQELYRGAVQWRQSASDIVVFKSVGIGLSDLAAAVVAWENYKRRQPRAPA
jgi:ornithine cyclodeaminase